MMEGVEKEVNVLIVEDDKYISNFICMSLKQEGYHYLKADTGREAIGLSYANNPDVVILDIIMPKVDGLSVMEKIHHNPDVVILDLVLPDMDGMEVIEHIRSNSDKPIIVVSARQEETEKIKALDLGADDYVVKPFHMGELLARIRVAIRKSEQNGGGNELGESFECDYLRIDFVKRMVFIDDKEIHVTPIEYKLLTLLVSNRGKVLTHNYIQNKIWGYGEGGDPNSLRVFMATLRRKIEKDTTNPRFIITEVGVGYRFSE